MPCRITIITISYIIYGHLEAKYVTSKGKSKHKETQFKNKSRPLYDIKGMLLNGFFVRFTKYTIPSFI